jgi:hypothetical protein
MTTIGGVFNPYYHIVPLFDFTKASPELNGTGVFIAVDDHCFVVTATHVLEESYRFRSPKKKLDGTMKVDIFGPEKLVVCKAQAQTNEGDPQRATYKDHLDLALIHLPKPFREWLAAHYTPFDLRANKPRDGVALLSISGWPARKNVFNRKKWEFEGVYRCFHIQTQAVKKNWSEPSKAIQKSVSLSAWTSERTFSAIRPGSTMNSSSSAG